MFYVTEVKRVLCGNNYASLLFIVFSPERHKAIWCGKLVRRRNCLLPELYNKLNQEISLVTMQDINPCFAGNSIAILDVVCRWWNSNRNIKPFYDQRTRNHKNFGVGLISMIIRLKKGKHASIVAEHGPKHAQQPNAKLIHTPFKHDYLLIINKYW